MAIEGPLHELALTDVLQLLDLSRKTGVLSVERDGTATPARICLEEGTIVGVRATGHTRRLGELLLLAGKATQGQIDRAKKRQAQTPGRPIGAFLEEEGVPSSEIKRQLRFQIEELIYDLVRWKEGHFRFEESGMPDAGGVTVKVTTESLLMEAMRRMDEWAELSRAAPDTELIPGLVEVQPDGAVLELEPAEWEILAAVDGERSLRGIAREVGRGEFEVAKAVFGLVSAGIVEVGARRHLAATTGERHQSGGAGAALREGRAAASQQRWMAATDAFSRAVAADPLLAPAYFDLGLAATRAGELDKAEEAFRTFLRLDESEDGSHDRARRAASAIAELRRVLQEEGK
jgi:hypothetical protein